MPILFYIGISLFRTSLSFGVTLDKPGDFYEFQVDAVNDGTLDAMLSIISTTVTSGGSPATLPSYIKYTVKYADDEEPVEKHLLRTFYKR